MAVTSLIISISALIIAAAGYLNSRRQTRISSRSLSLARASRSRDDVERARQKRDEVHDHLDAVIRCLAPDVRSSPFVLPDPPDPDEARNHIDVAYREIRRLSELGPIDAAAQFMQARGYAQAAIGVLDWIERRKPIPPDEVPTYTLRFDEFVLNVRGLTARGDDAWREWCAQNEPDHVTSGTSN